MNMTKKLALLSLLALCALSGFAQDKFLKDAMKLGRQPKQLYEFSNTKSKYIDMDKLMATCRQNNYYVGSYTQKEVGRFGDYAMSVDRFHFIPASEYDAYIFENINSGGRSYSSLTQRGIVFFYTGLNDSGNHFTRHADALWSGETKNGLICGTGEGFKKTGTGQFIYFSGTFADGIPVGEVHFQTYKYWEKDCSYEKGGWHTERCITGHLSDGLCWFKDVADDYKYGYIDQNGITVIKPVYKTAGDFTNGVALVKDGYSELKIDKTGKVLGFSENSNLSFYEMVRMKEKRPELAPAIEASALKYAEGNVGFEELLRVEKEFPNLKPQLEKRKTAVYKTHAQKLAILFDQAVAAQSGSYVGRKEAKSFIDIYGKYSFDPDGMLPKAHELDRYNEVCEATGIYVSTSSTYWEGSKDNMYRPKFNDDCYNTLSKLDNALSICKKGKQSAFAAYYSKAEPGIASQYQKMRSIIDRDRANYDYALQKYEGKQRQIEDILRNINANNIYQYVVKEEDWSRGRVFDSDDDFKDDREVEFKNLEYLGHKNWDYSTVSETIYEVYNREERIHYFYVSTGLFSQSLRYTTYVDCLIAAFLSRYHRSWNRNTY